MTTISAERVQAYLEAHRYMTLPELAARAGTTATLIQALENAQCIPAASYQVGGEARFTSSFGTYALPMEPQRYYHPSVLHWALGAIELAKHRSLAEVARIVRANFDRAFHKALDGAEPPWHGGADYAWNFIIDGTWGLCLKEVSAPAILAKECARATIRRIVKPDLDHCLSPEERVELTSALLNFEAVTLPFAPHEVADSCRRNEIEPTMEKYGIDLSEVHLAAE